MSFIGCLGSFIDRLGNFEVSIMLTSLKLRLGQLEYWYNTLT